MAPELPANPQNSASERMVAFAVLGILALLMLPLPAPVLDVLLALNIAIAVIVLLVALRLQRPAEFSVFPSLLLITTLFRLGLNVATTRLILTHGSEGVDAAGDVIASFGKFAVGGSVVVGLVVFLILLVVNFTVITKGSSRISEVAARFTLDAMPGKQMAIDADLAAGVITDVDARRRRAAVEQEAEFFGAMDGASKFVRGDAVAGLIITAINIAGGLLAGVLRDHLSLSQAASTYTILTMGDGLVTQMPALLISTAAGMVVTRAGDRTQLGAQVDGQVLQQSGAMRSASVVMLGIGLLPGMPLIAFGALSLGTFLLSRREKASIKSQPEKELKKEEGDRIQDLLALDILEVEVGHGLLALIDLERGGELPGRITALRKQIAQELGVVLPSVHLRDNLALDGPQYRVLMRGVEIARGTAHADRLMALDGTGRAPAVDGIAAREPAFGLPSVWIPKDQRPGAEALGLTLVDSASVVTTHLGEVLRRNASELVGRQEVQELLTLCGKQAPKLVESVVPAIVSLAELVGVVRGLLRESVSVRDLRTILEAVADAAPRSKDIGYLVEQTRRRLARHISGKLQDDRGVIRALTMTRKTEDVLRGTLVQSDGEPALAPDLETARKIIHQLEQRSATMASDGRVTVLLAPPDLRRALFDFSSRFVHDIQVITARELVPGTTLEPAGNIDVEAAG